MKFFNILTTLRRMIIASISALLISPTLVIGNTILCNPAVKTNHELQNCVDTANPGDTVEVASGDWDFYTSPERVRLTKPIIIKGDNPNNPPLLRGNGKFGALINDKDHISNGAFLVYKQNQNIDGITIEHLKFKEFYRPIEISPERGEPVWYETPPQGYNRKGYYCDHVSNGLVSNVIVRNNEFQNNDQHVTVNGGHVDGMLIDNNKMTKSDGYAVTLLGARVQCGTRATITRGFGQPKNVKISNNHITTARGTAIWVDTAIATITERNIITGGTDYGPQGIVYTSVSYPEDQPGIPQDLGVIKDNDIRSIYWFAISVSTGDDSGNPILVSHALVTGNKIRSTGCVDIYLEPGANNTIVRDNNVISNSSSCHGFGVFPPIALELGSFENTVYVDDLSDVVDVAPLYGLPTTNTIILEP